MRTIIGEDGRERCEWGATDPLYRSYHDTEWGFGVDNDAGLFEKVVLEGFQAGLSWLTILRKRESFRRAFAGFDPHLVAGFGEDEVGRLVADATIVRHEGKIRSAINNAHRARDLIAEHGSLARFFWQWADLDDPEPPSEVPATTPQSIELSRELKRRGWTFVGPTTIYAFMQAMGLVNDHLAGCFARDPAERSRRDVAARVLG